VGIGKEPDFLLLAIGCVLEYRLCMTSRRERFRGALNRLDPIATKKALTEGWAIPPEDDQLLRMVRSLELGVRQTYLLMGGVGSGKTTELLRLKEALSLEAETAVAYVDVSAHIRPEACKAETLLVLAGLALCEDAPKGSPLGRLGVRFSDVLLGYWERTDDEPSFDGYDGLDYVPGLAEKPPPLDGNLGLLSDVVDKLVGIRSLVLLFDGLDRVTDLSILSSVIAHDLAAFSRLGQVHIATVIVLPLWAYTPAYSAMRARFDLDVLLPYRDPNEPTHQDWLLRVLSARDVDNILPLDVRARLVHLSGGVLRDLMMLARAVVEETYVSNSDTATPPLVERVAEAFGRKLLLGVGKVQLEGLQRLHREGVFELITLEDFELALHRRVLLYDGPRFAVHPTLPGILDRLAGARLGD
jgi:hypothetical protein